MNIFRYGLRLWITITSIATFLAGWILLAHAPKPSQSGSGAASSVAPVPTLAPLPPLENDNSGFDLQNRLFFNSQPQTVIRTRPFFSTGGS